MGSGTLLLFQAAVVGWFGGLGLSLTVLYSRRGPLIYPVYAALLLALTLLLARYSDLPYGDRFVAGLAGFLVASLLLYTTVLVRAQDSRKQLVAKGRLPASALTRPIGVVGHVWRIGFLIGVGAAISSAAAFVST